MDDNDIPCDITGTQGEAQPPLLMPMNICQDIEICNRGNGNSDQAQYYSSNLEFAKFLVVVVCGSELLEGQGGIKVSKNLPNAPKW